MPCRRPMLVVPCTPPSHKLAVGARDSSRSSAPTLNKGGGNARHGNGARSRGKGSGRNTASFDPESTYTRPDARIVVASPCHVKCPRTLSHDDIICVPELLCAEDDYKTYHKLLEELQGMKTEWTSWHEGCHLITKNAAVLTHVPGDRAPPERVLWCARKAAGNKI